MSRPRFFLLGDVIAFPAVTFFPRPYYVSFVADYDDTPKKPHVAMLVYPHVPPGKKPSGADEHYHIPLTTRQARQLRDWLSAYLGE